MGPIASVSLSAATVIVGLVVVVLTAYFIAARPHPLVNGVLSLFPPARRGDAHRVLRRIRGAWLGWLRGVPPVAFALTISPTMAVEVLVIYIAVHQVEANVIGPLVMSRAVHLHPAVIAFGVVAVGEVFGFIGLIIAVPILSLAAILIDELWVRRRRTR